MFDTVVIATDGSESAARAVAVAVDLAPRFDADVHALYVRDPDDDEPAAAAEIVAYVRAVDADAVATGTRGRHGEHSFLLGSVAEAVVRTCPVPVLTVRQLDGDEDPPRDVRP